MIRHKSEYLNLSHVSFAYGRGKFVFFDYELAIAPGEGVVVQGPTGFGKTTLTRLITGIVRPSEGEVAVRGDSISSLSAGRRAGILAQWGVVSGESTLLNDRSVGDNLRTSIRISSSSGRVSEDEIDAALNRFDLANKKSRNPKSLSTVERQLLQMAMAWARSPLLFVLDDLDSMLDAQTLPVAIEAVRERNLSGSAVVLTTSSPELYSSLSWRHAAIPTVR